MRTLRVVCLLAAGVLALAACLPAVAPTAPPAEPTATVESVTTGVDLAGTSWMLSSLNGSLPLAGTMVTLAFGADDSVSGTDGCNQFRGTYAQDGEKLTFEQPMATTMMACEEPIMAQATAYMQALTATTAFIAIGTQLILRSDSEMLATFVAQSQSLAGTAWEVLGYNNGRQAVVSLLVDTEITADFGADDQLSGNAGCNEYFAGYTADDGALTISEIGSTFRFCDTPEGVMQQEQEYLVALTTVATYGWEGNLMVLRTADGATAVQLAPRTLVDLPESEPGAPWGRVAVAQGVNIRSGPGVAFPVIGFARYGDEGRIVGRSADGQWWAVALPSAPDGMGWVSAADVIATGAEDVVVVEVAPVTVVPPPAAPPPAAPPPTPLPPAATQAPVPPTAMPAVPTATPAAEISFWANRTNINLGECSRLYWSAANVQGVWVFPQGEPYYRFPRWATAMSRSARSARRPTRCGFCNATDQRLSARSPSAWQHHLSFRLPSQRWRRIPWPIRGGRSSTTTTAATPSPRCCPTPISLSTLMQAGRSPATWAATTSLRPIN